MEPPSTRPWLGVGAALSALPAAGGCFCAALVLAVVADSDPGAVYEQHRWLGAIVAASAVCAYVAMMGWATLRHGGLPAPVLLIALALSGVPFLLPGGLFLPAAAIAVAGCAAAGDRRSPAPAALRCRHARDHRKGSAPPRSSSCSCRRSASAWSARPGHPSPASWPTPRTRRRPSSPRSSATTASASPRPLRRLRPARRPRRRRGQAARTPPRRRPAMRSKVPSSRPPSHRRPIPPAPGASSRTTTPPSTRTASPRPGRCSPRRSRPGSAASRAGARATRRRSPTRSAA